MATKVSVKTLQNMANTIERIAQSPKKADKFVKRVVKPTTANKQG